jgi:NAD kinase
MLPKIITVSMGSLNYLSNFRVDEYRQIIDVTALSLD